MSPRRTPFSFPQRAASLALSALTLAACDARRGGERDGATRESAAGEVSRGGWRPAEGTTVAGAPVAAVRAAIEGRLGGAAPAPVNGDQWRHTRAVYRRFGRTPLWFDAEGPNEARATSLLRALVDADRDALRLDAYPLATLVRALDAVQRGRQPSPEQIAEADVLLTSAFAALGEDLLTGQMDPRAVTKDWHIDPEEEAVDSALVRALAEPAVDDGLARMRPQDPNYAALREALVRYRELAARGPWPTIPAGRALKPGEPDAAARLQALRGRLAAEGLLDANAPATADAAVPTPNAVGADGATAQAQRARPAQPRAPRAGEAVYDAALAGAVAAYQASHAIVVDSVLGAETVASMNQPPAYRLGQIAANLERHRWMPRSLGTRHIAVNVPAFHLEAWDGGERALEMKVIVGEEYEDRRTAVFADTMATVVFRPYWFVTDDIANKELWPKQQANPNYFASNNYETFREGGQTRIRQTPGDENSLGLVKFLFPNAFNIYLHDTPNRELFGKDVRAFSHGCIRLEKPAELAQWVLGWPADSVRGAMQGSSDNQEVKVPRRVPVYITYFTVYSQDGQLRWGNDLYDRDAEMVRAVTAESGQRPETVQAVSALRRLVSE